jgi:AcrR family transcriptional regulator
MSTVNSQTTGDETPSRGGRVSHRELLLAGAIECLQRKGFAHTTSRDIVEASGTNLASIGYHFGSKEGLVNAALRESYLAWTERVNESVVEARERGAPPMQQMLTAWTTMLETLDEYRPFVVSHLEAITEAERSSELREELAAQYQKVRQSVADLIGEALPAIDRPTIEIIAGFTMAVCDGLAVQKLVDPENVPAGPEFAAGLVTGLLASIQEPPPTSQT